MNIHFPGDGDRGPGLSSVHIFLGELYVYPQINVDKKGKHSRFPGFFSNPRNPFNLTLEIESITQQDLDSMLYQLDHNQQLFLNFQCF